MPLRAHARRRFGVVPFTKAVCGHQDVPVAPPAARIYRSYALRGPAISMDPATGLVSIDVAFSIERPFEEVCDLLDPRSWDLGGKYFYPDGTELVRGADPEKRRCTTCGKSLTKVEEPGLGLGDDWDWKVLYEHFHGTDPSGFDVEFHNLLWVNPDRLTSRHGRPLYVVTYALHTSKSGRTDYVQDVLFERDDGDVSAERLDAGHTRVHMRKRIRFRSEWANLTTYIAYKYVGAATAEDLVGVVSAALPADAVPPSGG
jgi:hypothetical protein